VLKTKQKIFLARSLQVIVMGFRQILGLGAMTKVIRNGLCWQLDLREGIDFSIWPFGFFEPETVACYSRIIKSGDTVLNVAANIGAHTVPIAKLVGAKGRVLAFENQQITHSRSFKRMSPPMSGLPSASGACN
jgi:hypothetical protein